jgi:hypothetical protein
VDATPFRGKRVEFSARVRVDEKVRGNGYSIFVRALSADSLQLAWPNLSGRGEFGSGIPGWNRAAVRIDVPADSAALVYGFTSGRVWIDEVRVSVVGDSNGSMTVPNIPVPGHVPTPVPAGFILPQPANLDFEQPGIPISAAAREKAATQCRFTRETGTSSGASR